MKSFWKFLTEKTHNIRIADLAKKSEEGGLDGVEQSIYNNKYNIKSNFDSFSKDISARKIHKEDGLSLFTTKRQNEGIFAENITRIIFKGENLNHFTKNHPYVDVAVMEPMTIGEGKSEEVITKKNELISVKSTLEYSTVASVLRDTKAIKFDSLVTYLIYAYNLYRKTSQPFSVGEIQKGVAKYLNKRENNPEFTQYHYKGFIILILQHIIRFAKNPTELNPFEVALIRDIERFLTGKISEKNIKRRYGKIKTEIRKLTYPISLSIIFIGKPTIESDSPLEGVEGKHILNVYKTNSIPLGKFFFNVMNKWIDNEYFGYKSKKTGKLVEKYLNMEDIIEVYQAKKGNLFPTKIHIDLSDFGGKEKGNERKRLYVATALKDGYYGKSEEEEKEILDSILKLIKKLEKDKIKIDDFKKFLDNYGM
jgi:hypothetical protein